MPARFFLSLVPVLAAWAMLSGAPPAGMRELTRAALRDKIAGGWAGQMIGVSFGAPTEFRSNGRINEGTLPAWTPGRVSNALEQDDLYVDMTFAKVLDEKGIEATSDDFGKMFANARYQLWHANLAARRNLRRGVSAEESGLPKYNAHANDIDFQIESDFIGLMAPGLPQSGNRIAERAGRVMNYGDGIYGGMFVSAMYSAAFFEKDVRKVVESGLRAIPAGSPYARLISDVLAWSRQYPEDWRKVWKLLEDKWDRRDPCPEGALRPFNIDAKLNGGYVALGLLYGAGDFGKTIEVATRAGQDSDCNPASAGGILGVMLGYDAIPALYKSGIDAIADRKFDYTDFTFHSIVDSTERRALALIRATGGRVEADRVGIKVQEPKAGPAHLWDDYGEPGERIAASDRRWTFTGAWTERKEDRVAAEAAAEATVTFRGTGAILAGPFFPDGGKADVYLDGRLHRTVDANSDEKGERGREAVWHAFGLQDGEHTIRLRVRGEPFRTSGTRVGVTDLIVFRPAAH